jgi:hypothetical protein
MFSNHSPHLSGQALRRDFGDQPRNSLTLTKEFKGVEFQQSVRLLEVRAEDAQLQAADPSLAPIFHGEVCLHSSAFSIPIKARVQATNQTNGALHLSGFSYPDWKERQVTRVQPKEPVEVRLVWQKKAFRLNLEDISVLGAGVTSQGVDPAILLEQGSAVHLDFQLQEHIFEHLEAVVVYQVQVGQMAKKFGLSLFPTRKQQQHLEQYVSRRSQEIMDEVRQLFNQKRMLNGSGSPAS